MDLTSQIITDLGIPAFYFDVSPDGNKVSYATGGIGGGNIEVADSTNGSFDRRLTDNTITGYEDREPNYSKPDGLEMFFARNDGSSVQVWRMNSNNGSGQVMLTTPIPFEGNSAPVSSLNGRVGYTRNYFGGSDVITMDRDGSNENNVTNTPAIDDWIGSFDPTGNRLFIVSSRYTSPTEPEIISISAIDGSNPMRESFI